MMDTVLCSEPLSNPAKIYKLFGGYIFKLDMTLKMETTDSSETFADFYYTHRSYPCFFFPGVKTHFGRIFTAL